jgi:hypothetical protein
MIESTREGAFFISKNHPNAAQGEDVDVAIMQHSKLRKAPDRVLL